MGNVVNRLRCCSPSPLCKTSIALGIEPATFLGSIDVMVERGIVRCESKVGLVRGLKVEHGRDSPW